MKTINLRSHESTRGHFQCFFWPIISTVLWRSFEIFAVGSFTTDRVWTPVASAVPTWWSTCATRPKTWSRTSRVPETCWLKRCGTLPSTCRWTPSGGRRSTSLSTATCRSSTGSWTTWGGTRPARTKTNRGSVRPGSGCVSVYWCCVQLVIACVSCVGCRLVMWCLLVTEPSNVISILISSEFLKMDTLVSVAMSDAWWLGLLLLQG